MATWLDYENNEQQLVGEGRRHDRERKVASAPQRNALFYLFERKAEVNV